MLLAELTAPEAEQRFRDGAAVLIPIGAGTKSHGPHLPLDTSTMLSGQVSLDRPLKLPVRDFALVRLFGGGGYEVQRKWGLAL